jgi:acetyl esterase/lipase
VTQSPFHPDLRRIAAVLPRRAVGPRLLPVARALRRLEGLRRPGPGVEVRSLGDISVRVHRPPARATAPHPAVLWIHGGGYVIGSAAQDDAVCRHLAAELGALVAAVDYRLAPEHRFPVPLHDCHDALVWLAGRHDVDPERVAIGGASAGGGLAAALALLARDRGEVRPAFQLLSYPMLDDRTALRTDIDERHFRLWNNRANAFGWRSYTGLEPGSPEVGPLAAAARGDDLSGLPPAWIGVGSLDLFLDEDLAYATRLRAAGVPCAVHVVEGAFHGFDSVRPGASVTGQFRAAQVDALAPLLVS